MAENKSAGVKMGKSVCGHKNEQEGREEWAKKWAKREGGRERNIGEETSGENGKKKGVWINGKGSENTALNGREKRRE